MDSILLSNSPRKRITRRPNNNPFDPNWKFSRLRCKSDQCLPMNYISPKKKKQGIDLSSLIKSIAQSKLVSLVQENQQLKQIVEILKIQNQQYSQELEIFKSSKESFFSRNKIKNGPQSEISQSNKNFDDTGRNLSSIQMAKIKNNDSTCLQSKFLRARDSNISSSTISNLFQGKRNQQFGQQSTIFINSLYRNKQAMRYYQLQEENGKQLQNNLKKIQIRDKISIPLLENKQYQSSQKSHAQIQSNNSQSHILYLQSLVKIDEESSELNILDLTQSNIKCQNILRLQSKRSKVNQLNSAKESCPNDVKQFTDDILTPEQQQSSIQNLNLNQTYSFHNANVQLSDYNLNTQNINQIPSFIRDSHQNLMYAQKKNQRKSRMRSRLLQLQNRQYFSTKDKQKKYLQDKVVQLSGNLRQANKTIAKLQVQLDSANINIQVLKHKLKVKDKLLDNFKIRECQRVILQMSDGFNQTKSIENLSYFNINYNPSMKQQSIAGRCQQLLGTYEAQSGKKMIENIKMKIGSTHQRTLSTDNGCFGLRVQDKKRLRTTIKTRQDILKNSMENPKSNSIISNFKDLCKQSYKNSISSKINFGEDLDQSLQMCGNNKQVIEDTLYQNMVEDFKD